MWRCVTSNPYAVPRRKSRVDRNVRPTIRRCSGVTGTTCGERALGLEGRLEPAGDSGVMAPVPNGVPGSLSAIFSVNDGEYIPKSVDDVRFRTERVGSKLGVSEPPLA